MSLRWTILREHKTLKSQKFLELKTAYILTTGRCSAAFWNGCIIVGSKAKVILKTPLSKEFFEIKRGANRETDRHWCETKQSQNLGQQTTRHEYNRHMWARKVTGQSWTAYSKGTAATISETEENRKQLFDIMSRTARKIRETIAYNTTRQTLITIKVWTTPDGTVK